MERRKTLKTFVLITPKNSASVYFSRQKIFTLNRGKLFEQNRVSFNET
jgi:hypothetical protein